MEFRHILAPTDFSEYSKKAVASALELAKKFGAKLSILHVVELPPYPVEGYVPPNLAATFRIWSARPLRSSRRSSLKPRPLAWKWHDWWGWERPTVKSSTWLRPSRSI